MVSDTVKGKARQLRSAQTQPLTGYRRLGDSLNDSFHCGGCVVGALELSQLPDSRRGWDVVAL